jgi:hypothetical protein
VEILKFAEPPKRSSRTNTKKRGGIMPLLAVVVSVAVVGGMSTTLAGTISLNTGGSVEFGQGVVTTAACDTSIRILPSSSFDTSTSTFSVSQIEIRDIGTSGGTDTATAGAGCLGKKLTFKAYDKDGVQLNMNALEEKSVFVTIPDSGTATTDAAPNGSPNDNTQYNTAKTGTLSVLAASTFGGTTGTNGDTVAGKFTIGGLKIPGSVVKITLESSDA